jgi:hypothetical protein
MLSPIGENNNTESDPQQQPEEANDDNDLPMLSPINENNNTGSNPQPQQQPEEPDNGGDDLPVLLTSDDSTYLFATGELQPETTSDEDSESSTNNLPTANLPTDGPPENALPRANRPTLNLPTKNLPQGSLHPDPLTASYLYLHGKSYSTKPPKSPSSPRNNYAYLVRTAFVILRGN